MNKDLVKLIHTYGTQNHKEVDNFIKSISKTQLSNAMIDLLTEYFNDKNSSTLREFLVLSLHGFERLPGKIGYNGFRTSSINSKVKEYCEVKPKNIITDASNDAKRKLNGGGNFTDYSWQKFARHKKENPVMLVAGFIDGRLIYSFKFPFNSTDFKDRIEEQLQRKFPDGDRSGYYLRSAQFSFKHYINSPTLEKMLHVTKDELLQMKKHITGNVFAALLELTDSPD